MPENAFPVKFHAAIIEKINLVQKQSAINLADCLKEANHAVQEIAFNICRAEKKIIDALPYDVIEALSYNELINVIKDSDIISSDILNIFKKIPEYGNNGSMVDISTTEQCLNDLGKIVQWYFEVFLRTTLPGEIENFVYAHHGLKNESLNTYGEKKVPIENLNENDRTDYDDGNNTENWSEIIKKYTIPDYAIKLVELNANINVRTDRNLAKNTLSDINSLYDMIGLQNDVDRAIFYLLCYKSVQTRKPINYNSFLEFIIKWSLSQSAKNIRSFPTTEKILNSVLENLLALLSEKRLIIESDQKDLGRFILLQKFDKQQELMKSNNIHKLEELIQAEMQKTINDQDYPFPTFKSLQFNLRENKTNISGFFPEPIKYQELSRESLTNDLATDIISIEYTNNVQDFLCIPKSFYNKLPAMAAQKIYQFFNRIETDINTISTDGMILSRINGLLKNNFPNNTPTLNLLLSTDRIDINSLWSVKDPDLNYWLFILKDLNENLGTILKLNNNNDRAIIQSVSLMYQIVLQRRQKQTEIEEKKEFCENLVKLINSKEKVWRESIRSEWLHKLEKGDSEDETISGRKFAEFMASFLNEYSLQNKPDNFIIELPVINQKTKILEYCYVHNKNLLALYKKNIEAITDKQYGIKETAFIQRLSYVLEKNNWSDDSQNIIYALDSDDDFARYLSQCIQNFYNELFVIDNIFETNNEILRYLIRINNEKTSSFFDRDDNKIPLSSIIGVTRLDIIRQMRNKNDFLTRFFTFLSKLFPFFNKKMGARLYLMKILDDQHKNYGRTSNIRHDIISISGGKRDNKGIYANNADVASNDKQQKTPGKDLMDVLFQVKKSPVQFNAHQKQSSDRTSNRANSDIKLNEKVTYFKKALLQEDGFNDEKEYLAFYLKKWSIKPADDEKIIQEIMTRKDVGRNLSWQAAIKRDMTGMKTLDNYLDNVSNVAKAVISTYNKKHINIGLLTSYLAMYILINIERSL